MDPRPTAEHLLDQAKETLKRDGHHAPVLFVYGKRENVVVLLEFSTPDEKYTAMYVIGRSLAGMHPVGVGFVSEAWMSTSMPDEGKQIADMADKTEALAVTAQTRRLRTWSVVVPFVKVGQEIIFGEPMQGADVESDLLDHFWRGVLDAQG